MESQHNIIGIYSDFKGFSMCVIGGNFTRLNYYFYDEKFDKSCSIATINSFVQKMKTDFKVARIHINDNASLAQYLRENGIVYTTEINVAQDMFNLMGLIEDKKFSINPELHDSFLSEISNFDVDIVNHRLYAVFVALKRFYYIPRLPYSSGLSFYSG